METKEELISCVKSWIDIDNQLSELKAKIKILNQSKKQMTQKLTEVMKTNELECLDIKDGSLHYKANRVKKALSSKSLLKILETYCKDVQSAKNITDYVMEHREEQVKEVIKRKIDK